MKKLVLVLCLVISGGLLSSDSKNTDRDRQIDRNCQLVDNRPFFMIKKLLITVAITINCITLGMKDPEITIITSDNPLGIKVKKSIAQRIPLLREILENVDDNIKLTLSYATKEVVNHIIAIAENVADLDNLKNKDFNDIKIKKFEQQIDTLKQRIAYTKGYYDSELEKINNKITFYEQNAKKTNRELLDEAANRELNNQPKIAEIEAFYDDKQREYNLKKLREDFDFAKHQKNTELYNLEKKKEKKNNKLNMRLRNLSKNEEFLNLHNVKYPFYIKHREIVRNVAKEWPLFEQIQTILLADYLLIPMELIEPMIEALNNKQVITRSQLEKIESYKRSSQLICDKIMHQLLENPRPIETLDFKFTENDNHFLIKNLGSAGHTAVAFSPDGKNILFGCSRSVKLYNLDTKELKEPIEEFLVHHIANAQFNSQGTAVGITNKDGYTFAIYNVKTNKLKRYYHDTADNVKISSNFAFNHDGKHIALGFLDGFIRLYEIDEHEAVRDYNIKGNDGCIKKWQGSNGSIEALAFSKDYLASSDKNDIQIWDSQTGEAQRTLKGKNGDFYINNLKFNDGGTLLAAGSHSLVKLWDPTTGELKKELQDPVLFGWIRDMTFTPDNTKLIVGYNHEDDDFTLWDLKYEKPLKSFKNNQTSRKFAIDPSGELFANASYDGKLTLWKFIDYKKLSLLQVAFIHHYNHQKGAINCQFEHLYDDLPEKIKNTLPEPRIKSLEESLEESLEKSLEELLPEHLRKIPSISVESVPSESLLKKTTIQRDFLAHSYQLQQLLDEKKSFGLKEITK